MTIVRTSHICPPIPSRSFDWCAYIDGYEESSALYGWGASEFDALKELGALLEDCGGRKLLPVAFQTALDEIENLITTIVLNKGV